ncbi:Gfo/Idh/MocA family protein [Paenibacillus senegalensis]|uniref:Gfo/Idh/MocA family protein n=1 Tax=Paenibacillus senegalensis TaxID=1465766 RepID=UPI000287E16D|nr:Gfo/Idh/MocA family oxidoreductase [Paenibacillus senegalensis]
MKKIGFIDYYLDEWHANNYPNWIRECASGNGLEWDVAFAWAEKDKEDGLSSKAWCEAQNVQWLDSVEELVQQSDAIIVLSPDHPEHHERLAQEALRSGKPVYMDKTFSPDLAAGIRMFELAERHKTPLFSSSALRFATELAAFPNEQVNRESLEAVTTSGPGQFANYAVHQLEMIVTMMGVGAQQVKSLSSSQSRLLVIDYPEGKQASLSQTANAPFQIGLQLSSGEGMFFAQCSDIFPRLIEAILRFFETGEAPVPKEETLEIMALLEAGQQALTTRDTWIPVKK